MTLDAQMPLGGAGSGLCHGTSWDSAWFGGDALPGVADCVGEVASEDAGRLSLDEAGELEVRLFLGSGVRKPTGGALRGASFSNRDCTLLSDRREALSLEPFTYPERHRSIYIFFKLARHSNGLRALDNTMKANYRKLGLLFLLLFMGAIMFASLVFVFEKDLEDTAFKTMFDAYWWAVITMTTVSRLKHPIICYAK